MVFSYNNLELVEVRDTPDLKFWPEPELPELKKNVIEVLCFYQYD